MREEYLVSWKPTGSCPRIKTFRSPSEVLDLYASVENATHTLDYFHVEHRARSSAWTRVADLLRLRAD
jgi:hypothetical protein